MKALAAQINPTIGDFPGNRKKILAGLTQAREKGCEIVIFPEMALCGYPPEDLLMHDAFIKSSEAELEKLLSHTKDLFVVVGLVRYNLSFGEKGILNSAAVIQDGKVIGYHDKWLLPTYDVFDERRYFEPGRETGVWEHKGKKIAVLICEDMWEHAGYVDFTRYEKDPVMELIHKKPDLLINISASPYHFQKVDVRIKVCQKASKTLNCPTIMCCQVGGNDQLVFDGYSLFMDEKAKLRKMAKGFEEDQLIVDLDHLPPPIAFTYDAIGDLFHALVLGVKDYFVKQRFKKALLGLSGGIDSAVVACIVAEALGKENVLAVLMPSRYSSEGSVKDAEVLADRLGIERRLISIEEVFSEYLKLFVPHFKGHKEDVTEENIQPRVRGIVLMALSNKFGHIVVSTGNKSEMALGYCTLYGDMCGGLGVLSDVTKTLVYELARWINRNKEIIPKNTIEKPPSAELKPDQKDTDSLPPYEVVDQILQAYVEDFLSIEEIISKYKISEELVRDLVHRIHLAEYKRRQAAPGIRVSKKAFHVGRHYPIVQKWH